MPALRIDLETAQDEIAMLRKISDETQAEQLRVGA